MQIAFPNQRPMLFAPWTIRPFVAVMMRPTAMPVLQVLQVCCLGQLGRVNKP